MTMEPDEDEDPTRKCTHCQLRPRWSRHWACKRCVVCAGKSVRWCLLQRKREPGQFSSVPRQVRSRELYRMRREQGQAPQQAKRARSIPPAHTERTSENRT